MGVPAPFFLSRRQNGKLLELVFCRTQQDRLTVHGVLDNGCHCHHRCIYILQCGICESTSRHEKGGNCSMDYHPAGELGNIR